MSGILSSIPPPLRTSYGNTGSPSPNRVDTMPTNDTNNNTNANNTTQNVVDENLLNFLIREEVLISQMFLSLKKRISQAGKL
ncbi:hypothetical protein Tco_1122353, partial [Tanacetum coccineum]